MRNAAAKGHDASNQLLYSMLGMKYDQKAEVLLREQTRQNDVAVCPVHAELCQLIEHGACGTPAYSKPVWTTIQDQSHPAGK